MNRFLKAFVAACLFLSGIHALAQSRYPYTPQYTPPYTPSYSPERSYPDRSYQYYQPSQTYSQAVYVGIPSSYFNQVYAEQQNSQWCWAACIQMILNYYGLNVSQYDIVRRTYGFNPYGRLPNWAGSYETITANLNNWSVDRNGVRYLVRASIGYGMPNPATFVSELDNQYPVLLGYPTGGYSGHAVVATAAGFYGYKDDPTLASVVVRDPRRSTLSTPYRGRMEYDASMLRAVEVYWYIRVQRADDY
jgi:hypothetical protein